MQRTHTIPSPQTTMKMYNLLSSSYVIWEIINSNNEFINTRFI
jgi:hypothetical protein